MTIIGLLKFEIRIIKKKPEENHAGDAETLFFFLNCIYFLVSQLVIFLIGYILLYVIVD